METRKEDLERNIYSGFSHSLKLFSVNSYFALKDD